MAAVVQEADDLELTAPVGLSICCFRYVPSDLARDPKAHEDYLDALNGEIMTRVQLDGRAYCSNAIINGRFSLRACIVNFRTEASDIDVLLSAVQEIGRLADSELRAA
jgi:glutamate/tyrosine decarboxylase-like PLP-dependent enzyme